MHDKIISTRDRYFDILIMNGYMTCNCSSKKIHVKKVNNGRWYMLLVPYFIWLNNKQQLKDTYHKNENKEFLIKVLIIWPPHTNKICNHVDEYL